MPLRNGIAISHEGMDCLTGRGDPQERYRLYRLCLCVECLGAGKRNQRGKSGHPLPMPTKCQECRGEGKTLSLVATAGNPAGLGEAIISNALEGMLDECPIGILDDETGHWLVRPWMPSARNVSDAGRTLGQQSAAIRRERENG